MTDIGELVGSLLASLAHARRITDQETAEIAEYYKNNPLLEGMSVPRVRVPEMVLELPMLIETYTEGKVPKLQTPDTISSAVIGELSAEIKKHGVTLTEAQQEKLKISLSKKLNTIKPAGGPTQYLQREKIVRLVNDELGKTLKDERVARKISREENIRIAKRIEEKTREVTFKDTGVPPKIKGSIVTADIKDKTAPDNAVRLKIVMKEEGLEWTAIDGRDDASTKKLLPE